MKSISGPWAKIFKDYNIFSHDFSQPFYISASEIKKSVQNYESTGEKEVRLLCKHDTREDRPEIFKENNLFILPTKNKHYAIVQGEGYVDIPEITSSPIDYDSKLTFRLDTAVVGDSEMQHVDMAFASSVIRTFMNDPSLVLSIRGRKYTPEFSFNVNSQKVDVVSVQTEVDAGYEGINRVVLIEAKAIKNKNTIIRQLYYPLRQWQASTNKAIHTLFFGRDKSADTYNIWEFVFDDIYNYNSIRLEKSARYKLKGKKFEEKSSIGS